MNPSTKFFDRALFEGCAFFGGLFALAVAACIVLSSCTAQAQPPPTTAAANRDKLDLEIAVAKAKGSGGIAAGRAKCGCDKCECPPGKCGAERLTSYDEAFDRAKKLGIPVVVFCDLANAPTAVRCCGDSIPTRTLISRTSFRPEKPIAVIAPLNSGVQRIVGTFPADVSRSDLLKCVAEARQLMDADAKK